MCLSWFSQINSFHSWAWGFWESLGTHMGKTIVEKGKARHAKGESGQSFCKPTFFRGLALRQSARFTQTKKLYFCQLLYIILANLR